MSPETQRFDTVIIGGGPGGYVAAIRAAQLGQKTALVEKNKLGGTCLHIGCIPTKGLIHHAEVYRSCLESEKLGITTGEVSFDWSKVMERQAQVIGRLHKGVEFLMKKNDITVFHGHGSFLSSRKIAVQGDDQNWEIEADKVIVATGSVARTLPGIDIDEQRIISNIGALSLSAVPESMVVIGAGAVGVEFACIYRSFGCEVTILEYMPRLVPLEDEEVSRELERMLKRMRIKVLTGVAVQGAVNLGEQVAVRYQKGEEEHTIEADVCLCAVGRRAMIEGIGLENTAVETERGVIKVDEFCRTNDPAVYAIGDAIGNYLLAHVAEAEGYLAASHLAGSACHKLNYQAIPRCTYSYPQIGSVGLSEKEATDQGIPVQVGKAAFQANGKALAIGHPEGFSKLVQHAETGQLLGAHIIGPEATELIHEFVLAITHQMKTSAVAEMVHAHPTLSEVNMEALHQTLGEPLHG